jgi:polyisoprenoid-binding protein YceI
MQNILKCFLSILLVATVTSAKELQVDKSKENLVKFISDAPLEDFEGVTKNIDGYVFWKGNDTLSTSEFYFEVDLNTIDTGIGLRNRHMRDNYLETDKHQFAKYDGKISEVKKIADGQFEIATKGKMTIHGVERKLEAIGKVTVENGNYRLQCDFELKLTDYKIKVPKLMFMKIDENIKMKLDFHLKEVKEN